MIDTTRDFEWIMILFGFAIFKDAILQEHQPIRQYGTTVIRR